MPSERLRLKSFDSSLRTAYAQAKEVALAQGFVPLLTAGSLQVETRSGRRFVYRYRYDARGKRVVDYLGPQADGETAKRVEQAAAEIQECQEVAEASRRLRRIGFYGADNSTVVTLAALFNAGVFGAGGILVGTHAFGALLNELGFSASPFPITEDIDIACVPRIQLAVVPEDGMLAILAQTGLPFHEVPQLKRGAASTSFKVRGRRLKVDLLIPGRGEPYQPIFMPELRSHAMALPHLSYLLEESFPSILIGRNRIVPVSVPHPGRFCVHKLAVFSLRSGGDNPKRRKDLEQAAVLAEALEEEREFLLIEAIEAVPSSMRSKVRAGAREAAASLEPRHPAAAQRLASLARR